MADPLYKIMTKRTLEEAERIGQFAGSSDDLRDGFIHLSAAHQLEGTLAKHFPGQDDLVLVAIDAMRLGPCLKWETSRGGALFPHLYAVLDLSLVLWCEPLIIGEDGLHRLPERVAA